MPVLCHPEIPLRVMSLFFFRFEITHILPLHVNFPLEYFARYFYVVAVFFSQLHCILGTSHVECHARKSPSIFPTLSPPRMTGAYKRLRILDITLFFYLAVPWHFWPSLVKWIPFDCSRDVTFFGLQLLHSLSLR